MTGKAIPSADQQDPRVAVVTGANGAIGRGIAQRLAAVPDREVVLLCRDAEKGAAAAAEIQARTGDPRVRHECADVSRRSSVQSLADRWTGRIHILVNNAAVAPRSRGETSEAIELQFATNVLGYFWMIEAFRAALEQGAPSRVVNVASYWAGGLDLRDLEFKRRRYDNDKAYRQSKQAGRMLTVAFAERLRVRAITVNACHPGDVHSKLSNDLGFGGHETPDEGARTPVWLATDDVGGTRTGRYFEHLREVRCRFGEDRGAVEALYQACLGYR
jgi:NAD(P)-dependent dehydrogenase (short-subunit alcohol dehydrogenase family)